VVYLCEGAGAEIVESGQIWRGSEKRACDLGHLQLGEEGVPCYCGRMACLENIASSAGLQRLALARGLAKEGQPISVDELAQMARDGFKPARELWQLFGKTLGKGLDVLCVIANPETIVIYGPVAEHADLFLEEAIAQVDQGALPRYRRAVKFEVSPVHEDAVCAGACACVLRRVFGATQDFLESVV